VPELSKVYNMKSSYLNNDINYGDFFKQLCFVKNPSYIVEFGILDGFSLKSMQVSTSKNCRIDVFDIFDEFVGNKANLIDIQNKFKDDSRIHINKENFYSSTERFQDNSIDILHVDIANTGDIYDTLVKLTKKLKDDGILILEGGSKERDEIEWMKKYDKKSLHEMIQRLDMYENITLGTMPSITFLRKKLLL